MARGKSRTLEWSNKKHVKDNKQYYYGVQQEFHNYRQINIECDASGISISREILPARVFKL